MRRAAQEGALRGFRSSPALLLQDQPYSGRIDEFGLDGAVKLILLERRQFDQQPALQIDLDKGYRATLITEKGEVQIELFPRTAPAAVNNFVFLARQGWYNDITFHLVTSLLVQTGDPSGTGLGTAGYFIFDESDNGLSFDREGLVAMASQRGIRNSASSQFFITLGPMPPEGYNGQFTIFGRVTAGMDVLRALRARDPFDVLRDPNPPPGDQLIRVDIIEASQNP
ncbi:MAG: peptidylprolyl isomerase [Anaerolineae bacterium]|nr:peptidylprolyl isomerase [Anaerolineae bacterium]